MRKGSNPAYETLSANIWGYMRTHRVGGQEMAACTGRIATTTFYERLRQPGDFRLSELISIAKKMGTTVSELIGEKGR